MPHTKNQALLAWVDDIANKTGAAQVRWCDGSAEEYEELCQLLVDQGTFTKLTTRSARTSYWAHSDPRDVARVEDRTFICSEERGRRRPDQQLVRPDEMRAVLDGLFTGAMRGRTLYVVPFSMGPLGCQHRAHRRRDHRLALRRGQHAHHDPDGRRRPRRARRRRVRALPALGRACRSHPARRTSPGRATRRTSYIAHFPETREIWSYGSGYGGNALLGKKCFALRIASVMARDEGWLAEHMLILKLTSPDGEVRYVAAAPSRRRAARPTSRCWSRPLPGWKVETDRRRHLLDEARPGRHAPRDQPRGRLLRRRPGHEHGDEPERDARRCARTRIFTNAALTDDGDVWWEGMTDEPPAHLIDWKGNDWTPESNDAGGAPELPLHRRRRSSARRSPPSGRTRPACRSRRSCFGGRRATVVPLVYEALNWEHGVFLGATMASETTAAPTGAVGDLRRDPFAMLPFCGYNMADYWSHWLTFGERLTPTSCRRSSTSTGSARTTTAGSCGRASARTSRVLEWIFDRCAGRGEAVASPIGWLPAPGAIPTEGLKLDAAALKEVMSVDPAEWKQELPTSRSTSTPSASGHHWRSTRSWAR